MPSLSKTRVRPIAIDWPIGIGKPGLPSSTLHWGSTTYSYEIASARLVGKYYPYGQEKPSATTNGTEKFTGYFRDSETGFDYANERFHNPGTGRFLTADQYISATASNPNDPGSWNRYAYTRGDPVNRIDQSGFDDTDADDCDPLFGCLLPVETVPGIDFDIMIASEIANAVAAAAATLASELSDLQNSTPTCSISLYERPAGGKHRPWQHTYIVIDDPYLTASGYSSDELILQAGPSNNHPAGGTLKSETVPPGQGFGSNKNNASNPNAPGNKEIGSAYTGADACLDIIDLLGAINNYNDGKQVPYLAVPIPLTGTYNSNSFTSTLLSDVGLSFGSPGFAPGWGPLFSVPNLVP